jgi:hypothetical protein
MRPNRAQGGYEVRVTLYRTAPDTTALMRRSGPAGRELRWETVFAALHGLQYCDLQHERCNRLGAYSSQTTITHDSCVVVPALTDVREVTTSCMG